MTRRAPFYNVQRIPLTTAGEQIIEFAGGLFQVIGYEDSNGEPTLEGMIELALTVTSNSFVPLRYNNKVVAEFERVKVRWEAQSGIVAVILMADGPSQLLADTPNPRQLVTSAIGATVAASAVTVGTSAVALTAADSSRYSVIIQNLGAADIYIGPSGVTTSSGLKVVAAGGAITLDKQTAAIYGISGSAGNDVRVFVEKT